MTTLEERREQIRSDFDATNQEIAALQNSITERQFKLARLDERFRAYTELIEEAEATTATDEVTAELPALDDLAAKRAALLAQVAEVEALMKDEREPTAERANLALVQSPKDENPYEPDPDLKTT